MPLGPNDPNPIALQDVIDNMKQPYGLLHSDWGGVGSLMYNIATNGPNSSCPSIKAAMLCTGNSYANGVSVGAWATNHMDAIYMANNVFSWQDDDTTDQPNNVIMQVRRLQVYVLYASTNSWSKIGGTYYPVMARKTSAVNFGWGDAAHDYPYTTDEDGYNVAQCLPIAGVKAYEAWLNDGSNGVALAVIPNPHDVIGFHVTGQARLKALTSTGTNLIAQGKVQKAICGGMDWAASDGAQGLRGGDNVTDNSLPRFIRINSETWTTYSGTSLAPYYKSSYMPEFGPDWEFLLYEPGTAKNNKAYGCLTEAQITSNLPPGVYSSSSPTPTPAPTPAPTPTPTSLSRKRWFYVRSDHGTA